MSEYSRRYLLGSLANGVSKLNLYAYHLFLALDGSATALARAGIVDYGGGNGLMALLARALGVGTVIYNDIYDESATDARVLARALGLEADHYVTGDVADLITYVSAAGLTCDAVCSYDVIEHVYQIEDFLSALPRLSDGPLRIVMGSGANDMNPRIRRSLMRLQRQLELRDREIVPGHKDRDSLRAYREARADMIRAAAPTLPRDRVDALADATRGLIRLDIEAVVGHALATGEAPPPPAHPTNTCDPLTGNWAEHLMDPRALAEVLAGAGMRATVLPGYYNPYLGRKGVVAAGLNAVIRRLGWNGLRLAPYYVLYAEREEGQ